MMPWELDDDGFTRGDVGKVARRLRRMLRPWRLRIVVAMVCLVGQTACLVAGPALVAYGIDSGIRAGDPSAIDTAALAYVVVACIGLVLGRYAILLAARIGETFLRDLRIRSFRHLMGLGLDFFEQEQTGRLVSKLTADVDALQEMVQTGLTSIVQNVLLFIGSTIAIFILSWQLALTLLVVVPPAVLATRWFRRESKRAYLEVRERISHNLATLQEGLAGVRVVQAFGRESTYALRFRETNEAQFD